MLTAQLSWLTVLLLCHLVIKGDKRDNAVALVTSMHLGLHPASMTKSSHALLYLPKLPNVSTLLFFCSILAVNLTSVTAELTPLLPLHWFITSKQMLILLPSPSPATRWQNTDLPIFRFHNSETAWSSATVSAYQQAHWCKTFNGGWGVSCSEPP